MSVEKPTSAAPPAATRKVGRPPVLDEMKKGQILAIIGVGCSRRTAARYVGCDAKTIRNTALRDPEFAGQLCHASQAAEIEYVRRINNAAKKEQYWRAAAWALERLNPEDFAKRSPGSLTAEEIRTLLERVGEILLSEVPVARHRKAAVKRLDRLLAKIEPVPEEPVPEKPPAENGHDDES
jgi:hypothetical protein